MPASCPAPGGLRGAPATGTRELAKTVRTGRQGLEGFDSRADEIAITRAGPTEPLVAETLEGEPDAGEIEAQEARDQQPEWAEDEVDAPEGQFAHEESLGHEAEGQDESATGEERQTTNAELTPMGNRRSAVTESDEIDYALPARQAAQSGQG